MSLQLCVPPPRNGQLFVSFGSNAALVLNATIDASELRLTCGPTAACNALGGVPRPLPPARSVPSVATLTRVVVCALKSRTNTSGTPFVSLVTRLLALDVNATTFPSPLSTAPLLGPLPCVPEEDTLTRVYCCASAGPAIPSATPRPHVNGSQCRRKNRRGPLRIRVNSGDTGPPVTQTIVSCPYDFCRTGSVTEGTSSLVRSPSPVKCRRGACRCGARCQTRFSFQLSAFSSWALSSWLSGLSP